MNIPKIAIEKAIEGGYKLPEKYSFVSGSVENPITFIPTQIIALDPAFWSSLGKSLGWNTDRFEGSWHWYAREFYDLVLNGLSTEKFWKELLNN